MYGVKLNTEARTPRYGRRINFSPEELVEANVTGPYRQELYRDSRSMREKYPIEEISMVGKA